MGHCWFFIQMSSSRVLRFSLCRWRSALRPFWSQAIHIHRHRYSQNGPLLASALGMVGIGATGVALTPCTCSSACKDGELLAKVDVARFSVMGTQLRRDRAVVQSGCTPNDGIVIVDSAGHHVINPGGPRCAKGAAQSIYKWLGIDRDDTYSLDVRTNLHGPGQAVYKSYGDERHVIHTFGPDLRSMPNAWDDAVEILARTYESVLREFVASGRQELRLLPVSGGILAGEYSKQMPQLTAAALRVALSRVPDFAGTAMLPSDILSGHRQIRLCIFVEAEADAYKLALAGK